MKTTSKLLMGICAATMATQALAQITFYEDAGFSGRAISINGPVPDFNRAGFNDRASSAVVERGRWEVCQDGGHRGQCVVLRRGEYPNFEAMGLNDRVSSVRQIPRDAQVRDDRYAPTAPAVQTSQITFFQEANYRGRSHTADQSINNLQRIGFNNQVSSAVVRGGPWEVCEEPGFRGQCVVLRRGQYPSFLDMGLNDRVSSMRELRPTDRIDDRRVGPPPVALYDYGRRANERLYQADITSVRAVVAAQDRRCWVEREQVVQDQRGSANVPGALFGAVLGGILGHQVGGGSGRDAATAVGVVAGAAIGGNVNRNGSQQVATQDVQRCTSAPQQVAPDYYDVTYRFRGQEHRVQMATPPGAFVTVNEAGEPRA